MRVLCLCILFGLYGLPSLAQDKKVQIHGGFESYYCFNFLDRESRRVNAFTYNHARQNDLNLNFLYGLFRFENKNVRLHTGAMLGSYVQYNLAEEPGLFRHVYEANLGLRLYKKIWFVAGVLPSHIGYEQVLSLKNFTLTRNISSDNTPYYQSGAGFQVELNRRWSLQAYLLNGWQKIRLDPTAWQPAYGVQIQYKLLHYIQLSYSSFVGDPGLDTLHTFRWFNNWYAVFHFKKRISAFLGYDLGFQRKSADGTSYARWASYYISLKYGLDKKSRANINARYEFYSDPENRILSGGSPIALSSVSIGSSITILKVFAIKSEWKQFTNSYPIFLENGRLSHAQYLFTLSSLLSF